jgi:TetR/AcrR family transcriptional regulator
MKPAAQFRGRGRRQAPAPPAPKLKRDAEATKSAILDAALEEFAVRGLAGARVDQIAETAGVNKALLYYYFTSKDRLYLSVVERVFLAMIDTIEAALDLPVKPREKLLALLDANFDVLAAHPAYARLLGQEMDVLKKASPALIGKTAPKGLLKRVAVVVPKIRAVLEEGVRTGDFRPVDIDPVLPLVLIVIRTAARGIPLGGQIRPLSKKIAVARRRAAAIDFISHALFTNDKPEAAK